MRAVLEGLARRSADVVAQLESDVGHRFERILAVGLPTTVPLWRSLAPRAYARPLVIVDEPETAASGPRSWPPAPCRGRRPPTGR